MRRALVTTIAALALAGHAAAEGAETCSDFGLEDADLVRSFCEELRSITGGGTRNMFGGPDEPPDWIELDALRDAYRVDPQKTLELIARIRNAGGLPPG